METSLFSEFDSFAIMALMRWFKKKKPTTTVSFATSVWENDWRQVLLTPDYLRVRQIQNHCFPFAERLLIINNVKDLAEVKRVACRLIEEGVLTRFVVAQEIADEMLAFFQLQRGDFRPEAGVHPDWIYYNALGPLAAIYSCQSDYLLYLTGDVLHINRPSGGYSLQLCWTTGFVAGSSV